MLKGYIVFVCSVSPLVCPSILPFVWVRFRLLTLSLTKFYFEVFCLLITLQPQIKNFPYLVWGYLGGFSSILHLWTLGHAPGGDRGQNLGHPNIEVYCSFFFIQPLIKEGWASDMFITSMLIDVWTSLFGIMNWYYPKVDLKVNVGHCDLYLIVHWYYVTSWRHFDVSLSYFGIMWPIFHSSMILSYISHCLIPESHIIYIPGIMTQCDPNFHLESKYKLEQVPRGSRIPPAGAIS